MRATLLAAFVVLVPAAALSQSTAVPPIANRLVLGQDQRDQPVRAQISIQLVAPSNADDASAEADKVREDARRSMYELAGRECALLLAVVATECRLENVNVNIGRQTGNRAEGFAVRATMSYRITPK